MALVPRNVPIPLRAVPDCVRSVVLGLSSLSPEESRDKAASRGAPPLEEASYDGFGTRQKKSPKLKNLSVYCGED